MITVDLSVSGVELTEGEGPEGKRESNRCTYFSHAHCRLLRRGEGAARWLLPASPGPWWSSEKAFAMRSSRMPARAEVLGRLDDTSGVAVVD